MDDNPNPGTNAGPEGDPDARRTAAAHAEEEANKREPRPGPVDPGAHPDDNTGGGLFETTGPNANKPRTLGDEPPPGAIATASDFIVQRDPNTGDVMPVWQRLPGTEMYAQVIPLSNSEAEARLPENGNALELSDDALLRLIKDKFVEPDFSDAETLDDILAYGLEPLVVCLNYASGFGMMKGIVSENSDLMELARAVEGNSNRTS